MPDNFDEGKFVIMMGGLHIEMGFLTPVDSYLTGSGWVEALEESGATTSGKADLFLQGAHVKRSRYVHQVTACSLYQLLKDAYLKSQENDFDSFFYEKSRVPQFRFWGTALELELLLLTFVRSLCEANFHLYVETLVKIAPWYFALDRVNYSRWLPVHNRDIQCLSTTHPSILRNFVDGKFVIHNSERKFSGTSIDQAHEQNNKRVKGQGGIIGLTSNESALNRWIVSRPEIAEMIKQFRDSVDTDEEGSSDESAHHKEGHTFQSQFKSDVEKLKLSMKENGNPFLEESMDCLIVLQESVENLKKIEDIGQTAYLWTEKYLFPRLFR